VSDDPSTSVFSGLLDGQRRVLSQHQRVALAIGRAGVVEAPGVATVTVEEQLEVEPHAVSQLGDWFGHAIRAGLAHRVGAGGLDLLVGQCEALHVFPWWSAVGVAVLYAVLQLDVYGHVTRHHLAALRIG
jgi:hypothetical protein